MCPVGIERVGKGLAGARNSKKRENKGRKGAMWLKRLGRSNLY